MNLYSIRPNWKLVFLSLTALTAVVGGVIAAVLILASEPTPAVASEPQVVFYRDGALLLSDLSGTNIVEVAPATARPSYGGWQALEDGQVAVFYTAVEGVDVVLHRRDLDTGHDETLLTVAKFDAPDGLTSDQVANPPSIRVSPDGKLALVATPQTVHLVDIVARESSEISISDPLGSFLGFSVREWSPDGKYALIHATRPSTDSGGANLVVDPAAGIVVGQVPGLHTSWSPDGERICSGLSGPQGLSIPRLWVSAAPSWEAREAVPGAIIPALSCDWIDADQILFTTEAWALYEGETSLLPTVIAEVYGATDKARPEETKVLLGTTRYILPVIGIANLETGQIDKVISLRQDIAPGSLVLETDVRPPLTPSIIAVPSRQQAIVSVEGAAPAVVNLGSEDTVAFLQPGDRVADVLSP